MRLSVILAGLSSPRCKLPLLKPLAVKRGQAVVGGLISELRTVEVRPGTKVNLKTMKLIRPNPAKFYSGV